MTRCINYLQETSKTGGKSENEGSVKEREHEGGARPRLIEGAVQKLVGAASCDSEEAAGHSDLDT